MPKFASLETFYDKIKGHLALVKIYTRIKEVHKVIKLCRMKPYNFFFGNGDQKIKLHKKWFDEFGTSLKLRYTYVTVIHNDLSLDRSKIASTDLYGGLSLSKIIKISKLMYLYVGKDDEDPTQKIFVLYLMGLDNYLRTYLWDGEWQAVSPLILGIQPVKRVMENKRRKYFHYSKKDLCDFCVNGEVWISPLPTKKFLPKKLNELYDNIFWFLT